MLKAGTLLKKPLIQVNTGTIIGHVEDLLLDPEQDRIVALITTTGGWLREAEIIPWEELVAIGDVLLIRPDVRPVSVAKRDDYKALMDRKLHVSGTTVVDTKGEKVGTVKELIIDAHGRLEGFMVSQGLFSGKEFIAARNVEGIGSDALVIKPSDLREAPPEIAPATLPPEQIDAIVSGQKPMPEEPPREQ